MFKLLGRCLVVLAFGWAGSASAAMLPPVQVNGQQWLQPIDFINNSWNDIAAVCDVSTGICNGSLGGNDLTGWNWAGIPVMHALFTSFGVPGFTGSAPTFTGTQSSTTWAPNFLATFVATYESNYVMGYFRYLADPSPIVEVLVGQVIDNAVVPPFIFDVAGTGLGFGYYIDDRDSAIGGWFYREVPSPGIPSPATLPLLGLALAVLGYSRRNCKQLV